MGKWMAIGMALALAGCASHSCDEPLSGSPCREERLLHQNDMLQAKLLLASGDPENYELAKALLDRAATQDTTGEAEFYQAVLMIRQGPEVDEVLALLERAAGKGHPHATALLYKVYAEPYLLSTADPRKANAYRAAYANLDVAKSGYPSFEQALKVVNALVTEPPATAAAQPEPAQ
ncbi:hypothetical protein D3880_15845 [Pseudomonas cavernae]|uniref:Sel1 repeat family protein n=1 Tax=Pseudomonas cavernae TaxID=2320867 RepID=A0A385Z3Q7_9PSED|nr:hypothetical protein [Pseudomonas cavernae]AYC33736.1 hypothetical protein D3880_15845 [Pseudomonas cavernae]